MPRPAPGVERTIALVTFLSQHPGRSFGLSELARRLDLNKATAHAMLATLSDAGWLRRDETEKTYRLGPALVAVGDAAAGSARHALEVARPHLRRLADDLGVQVVASSVMGEDIIILAVEGHAATLGFGSRPGSRIPLAPPLGTAFVAWSEPEAVEGWLHRLSPGLTDDQLATYREAIATIRRRGYTVALDGDQRHRLNAAISALAAHTGDDEASTEVRAAVSRALHAMSADGDYLLVDLGGIASYQLSLISAPVFDGTGRVCLAITLSGFREPLTAEQVDPYGRRLLDVTTTITKDINGHAPDEA